MGFQPFFTPMKYAKKRIRELVHWRSSVKEEPVYTVTPPI